MEYLAAARVAVFVEYVQKNDMQILSNRRTGYTMIQDSLVTRGETCEVLRVSNDKFDKLVTYLSQNDLQVHQADARSTIGIYAFVKIVAELRRSLRALDEDGLFFVGNTADTRAPRPPVSPALNRLGFSPAKRVDQTNAATGAASSSRQLEFPVDQEQEDAPESPIPGLKGGRGGSTAPSSRPVT